MLFSAVGFGECGFLSTPSARRATPPASVFFLQRKFLSTPSARRATLVPFQAKFKISDFYPRPPRGGRLELIFKNIFANLFLSTPSARRATAPVHLAGHAHLISIHALREEGDSKNGEKHLRFCFIIKRSAQIWKSFSKNIQKTAAICTERLENMVRRRRKRGERFPFAPREQARKSARLRIQTGDAPRYARPWSYSCCPVDKTADCPDRGR